MRLSQVKLNTKSIIKEMNLSNEEIKFRLMELGLVEGCEINVVKRSIMKKTLLIVFCSSCFTLKSNLADEIEVEYA